MRATRLLLVLTLAPVSLLLTAPREAAAQSVDRAACVAADKSAVKLVAQHQLVEAREQLQVCTAPECPAAQRKDCQRLSAQVDAAMPSIVFSASDPSGQEVRAVKVTVDGRRLADRLDGTALAVDPGEHEFQLTSEGHPAVTRTLEIKEGEKGRAEHVTLGAAQGAAPAPESAPAPAPAPSPAPPPSSTVGLVTGGLAFAGVTGIALGGIFGFLTIAARNQQQADCASPTSCKNHGQSTDEHATALSDGTISTVGFVAGGALLAGAAVYYFVLATPASSEAPAASGATGLVVAPGVGPGGAGMLLKGAF